MTKEMSSVGRVDLFDGDREALRRIEPVQLAAARHEMRIGENDEFHRCIVSRSHMAKSGEPSVLIAP